MKRNKKYKVILTEEERKELQPLITNGKAAANGLGKAFDFFVMGGILRI